MHAATLQELSGGRAILGIAAGAAGFLELTGISQGNHWRGFAKPCSRAGRCWTASLPAGIEVPGMWGGSSPAFAPRPAGTHLPGCHEPQNAGPGGRTGGRGAGAPFPARALPRCPWAHRPEDAARPTAPPKPSISPPACGCQWTRTVRRLRRPWRTSSSSTARNSHPYLLRRGGPRSGRLRPCGGGRGKEGHGRGGGLITPAMLRLGIAGTPEDVVNRCAPLDRTRGDPPFLRAAPGA